MVIQEKVDGLGNFHAPPPVFDCIMMMLICREYHNFLREFDKFLSWQVIKNSENAKKKSASWSPPKRNGKVRGDQSGVPAAMGATCAMEL